MRSRTFPVLATTLSVVAIAIACSKSGSRQVPLGPSPSTGPSGPLTTPVTESPTGGAQLATLRPALTVRNGGSGAGTRVYEFQVSDTADFSASTVSRVAGYTANLTRGGVPEGGSGTTSFTPDTDLQPATLMYWRARVSAGSEVTAWSSPQQFRTQLVGFNRPNALYDPLAGGQTVGVAGGSTSFTSDGLTVNSPASWVRYELATTLSTGVISVEVTGLAPNRPSEKARIFSMMDGGSRLFDSRFLFNVQYRGIPGNPDNAISYKVLMGDAALKYEPDFGARAAGVRLLNPATTYAWTATWGSAFRLEVREGGLAGPMIYERSEGTAGVYNPTPHTAYLGANDSSIESGSFAGATYRNFWVGNEPRPASLGSALNR